VGKTDQRPDRKAKGLSKSRFVHGCQCPKYLWWATYEPDAPELVPGAALEDIFEQGHEVGELARRRFPGGVLIDLDPRDPGREPKTRELIAAGVPAIFEATFIADSTYAAVDVLLRERDGFALIEVKSGKTAEDKYVLDAAVQTHVARAAGIDVRRVEIMHLNPEYVHPGPADLFVREDVTPKAEEFLRDIPERIQSLLAVLEGDLPEVRIGEQCRSPDECPFMSRCWPQDVDSVLNIPRMPYAKRFGLYHSGTRSVADLPADVRLNAVQERHRRAITSGETVVEHALREALEPYRGRLGFLDFETVARAVPVWDGTTPWETIPAQFSYHEGLLGGPYAHQEFIASPGRDPRKELAKRLVEVTRGAERVVMYTGFEATQIRSLQKAVPELAAELGVLLGKLIDLKKTVEQHVYHPEFGGSFSIKGVLPALVPGMTYDDAGAIAEGTEASALLAKLILHSDGMPEAERDQLRSELLAYCRLDTWAMVKLLEKLSDLTMTV
jgi:hypothetical protein